MEQTSMTARICAFARAYHAQHNEVKIFDDTVARRLLTDQEYAQTAKSMAGGIGFFNPAFTGTAGEALRWVVDNQLSPTPLGRAAFAERTLEQAARLGAKQYLLFGAGYDTFAYRQPSWASALEIFEIDHPATSGDKRRRLEKAGVAIPKNVHYVEADFTEEAWPVTLRKCEGLDVSQISCCAVLGVVYYLSRQNFQGLLSALSTLLPRGSSIVFDYPDERNGTQQAGERAQKQAMLAAAAKETMLAGYSYQEMERLLGNEGFLIYEHLTPQEMTEQYFAVYNRANPGNIMSAFDNVNYCLAVKNG